MHNIMTSCGVCGLKEIKDYLEVVLILRMISLSVHLVNIRGDLCTAVTCYKFYGSSIGGLVNIHTITVAVY